MPQHSLISCEIVKLEVRCTISFSKIFLCYTAIRVQYRKKAKARNNIYFNAGNPGKNKNGRPVVRYKNRIQNVKML